MIHKHPFVKNPVPLRHSIRCHFRNVKRPLLSHTVTHRFEVVSNQITDNRNAWVAVGKHFVALEKQILSTTGHLPPCEDSSTL